MRRPLVKRYVNVPYIEGSTLRLQREEAGLSRRRLSLRLYEETGIEIGESQLRNLEKQDEFPVDIGLLLVLQKILK